MIIEIDFYQHQEYITCSEEIGEEIEVLRDGFLVWLYDKTIDHKYWVYQGGEKSAVCYRGDAFVEWINTIKYKERKVTFIYEKPRNIDKRITF